MMLSSLSLALTSLERRRGGSPVPPPVGLTPALRVGYVDADGERHWDLAASDGSTTISGTAPFLVDFWAGESRSVALDATDDVGAYWNLGYRLEYGEGLGGTWPISGRSRDYDDGQPMFARAYTVPGTHTATLQVADSEGRQRSISLTVEVLAPPAEGVLMTSGVIPDFQNDTVYDAPAGGTWGDIGGQLNGRRNVIIRKAGEGADPVFGTVQFDGRNIPDAPVTRTAGVRFVNCDIGNVTGGSVAFDYCGVVGGRLRRVEPPSAQEYWWGRVFSDALSQNAANNVRYLRGLFLWDCGEINETYGYPLFGGGRGVHVIGCSLKSISQGFHVVRGVFAYSSFRHTQTALMPWGYGYYKIQGQPTTASDGYPDSWDDMDRVGDYASERYFGLPSQAVAIQNVVMGANGDTQPSTNVDIKYGEPDQTQGVELAGVEDSVYHGRDEDWFPVRLAGRGLGARNVRLSDGAGGIVSVVAPDGPEGIPGGSGGPWDGPYITTGARPSVT